MGNSIEIENGQNIQIAESIVAPVGQPAIDIVGDNTSLKVVDGGSIAAPDDGNTGVLSSGNGANIENSGEISGAFNGISSASNNFTLRNAPNGTITSDSRAVDITDGNNIRVINAGNIFGTGNQRNGTFYIDGTVDDANLDNENGGVIDAGVGNSGSGVSIQVGTAGGLTDGSDDTETSVDVFNDGLIQGRGTENVPAGLRLFVGSELTESTFTGNITNANSGIISSDQDAGILIEEGINFNGQIVNKGTIIGGNGLAINAAGASGNIDVFNTGTLEGAVVLGEGNDILLNQSSNDLNITGGGGNDILTGGSGVNVYSFGANSGQDVIADFQTSQDVLDFGSLFSDADQVFGSATQYGNHTIIDLGNDNSLTLANVEIASFSENNFDFG